MKKITLITLLVGLTLGLSAQDLNKVKDMLKDDELDKARQGIEGLLAAPNNQRNVDMWYTKAKIYGAIAASEQFKTLVADGRVEAFEALKRAQALDKIRVKNLLTVDKYTPVYDLYAGYFDAAATRYNEEEYEDALANFKKAGKIGSYIFEQGWGLYKLDTTVIFYSALSAMNAKKNDEAVALFRKLADAKVAASLEHVTTYRYLAKYYLDKKDFSNMKKYLALGLELYPEDDYLPLVELDYQNSQDN